MANLTIDTDKAIEIGDNVHSMTVDKKLIIVVDLTQEIGPSKSGKMMGVASTEGFVSLSGGLKLNLWVGKKTI